jgi:hypothetical protein
VSAAPVHYLRAAKSTWSPPHLYVLDTETRTERRGELEVETLRLWCAKIVDRRAPVAVNRSVSWTHGTTAAGLARSVDNASRHRETLWLFAHNLAFDLTTTHLPLHLLGMGWELGDFALSSDTPWMRLHAGKRSLTLVDSVSFLPASIAELGRMLGMRKPALPADDAPEHLWTRRCRADVAILATALGELMDWHDREGRGHWSVSGTSTAFGHLRRRLPDKAIVVDPSAAVQVADRAALYGGRRQCWRVGVFRGRRYLEIDLAAAYPTAAGSTWTPVRRGITFNTLPLDSPVLALPNLGAAAACRIATARPRYPLRLGDATWYPTGEFDTVLAGPELAEARARGELRSIGAGCVHVLAPVLRDWAEWIAAARADVTDATPAVVRHSLKVWGRTVIGRFAGHSWTRTELGPAPGAGWHYEPAVNGTTGLPAGIVDLGGRRFWTQQEDGAPNAYPAVTAWIESAVRVALGRVIDAIGDGAIVSAHTDGLIVAETALGSVAAGGALVAPAGLSGAARTQWVLDAASELVAPLRLVVKRSATHVSVKGPQFVRFGAQRKLSGIPEGATETAPDVFSFRAWPGLTWQMGNGDDAGYHRPMAYRRIDGPYPAGWILDDGTVHPPHAVIARDGTTRLLAWHDTPDRPPGRVLHGPQHPYLDGLP